MTTPTNGPAAVGAASKTAPPSAPLSLSATRISSFNHCPLQFKLAYLDKLDQRVPEVFAVGTAAHSAMEAWVRNGATGPAPDLPGGEPVAVDAGTLRQAIQTSTHVLTEWAWELQLAGVRVAGRADLVLITDDGPKRHVLVVDWKLSLRAPGSDLDTAPQVLLYGLVVKELLRADEVDFCFVALSHDHAHSVQWDFADEARALVADTAAAIASCQESGQWRANVSPECERCTMRSHCPAWRAATALGADPSCRVTAQSPMAELVAERQRLGTLAALAEEQRKDIDAWLREAIFPHDVVEAGGWRVRHATRSTPSLPVSEARAAIGAREIDEDAVFTVKVPALKKALADDPLALAYIEAQSSGHEVRYIEMRAIRGYEP